MEQPLIDVILEPSLRAIHFKLNAIKYNSHTLYVFQFILSHLQVQPSVHLIHTPGLYCSATSSIGLLLSSNGLQTHTHVHDEQGLIFIVSTWCTFYHDVIKLHMREYNWTNVWHIIRTLTHMMYFDICYFIFNANFHTLISWSNNGSHPAV